MSTYLSILATGIILGLAILVLSEMQKRNRHQSGRENVAALVKNAERLGFVMDHADYLEPGELSDFSLRREDVSGLEHILYIQQSNSKVVARLTTYRGRERVMRQDVSTTDLGGLQLALDSV